MSTSPPAASMRELAPEPHDAWCAVVGAVDGALAPGTTAGLAAVVRAALGTAAGDLPVTITADADLAPPVQAFAEQFVVDVSATTPEGRNAAMAELGAEGFPAMQVLYVLDLGTRLVCAWRAVFGVPIETVPTAGAELWPALERFMRAVARLDALDPVTTEVIRLRGARAHDCRLCKSIRHVRAAELGADDAFYDRIDDHETSDLDPRHRTALRIVDTMLWQPARPPDGLAAEVAAVYAPGETAEILLDVVRNAANKIAVAFGADDPHVADGVEYYDTDEHGDLVYGLVPTPARP